MSDCFFKPYTFQSNSKSDQTIKSLISNEDDHKISVIGYPDDEGIKVNGGKIGAALGPDSIRSAFYKMTPTESMLENKIKDLGNLSFERASLKERHQFCASAVENELKNQKRILSFGGGHDYGYVDGAGFLKASLRKPLIVNFDAHFDLRNMDKGISSGTPFFRLSEEFKNTFDLFEVGVQKQCNSKNLFEYAKSKNFIHTLHYDDLYPGHVFDFSYFKEQIETKTTPLQDCYLSVDIDGFSSAFAPGCSQSWPTGFDMSSFFMMFDHLLNRFNVKVLGVYEVSPPLDHKELTSRLAALISYRFLEKGIS